MDNKGFTLIELIAVLVIVSILASMAMVRYYDLDDNAKKVTTEYNQKSEDWKVFHEDLIKK